MIVCLAAGCPIQTARIEVWRYSEQASPSPTNVQRYVVLEDLTRQLNVPMFAERAATQDSPKLRKHLRAHVFIVKAQPDKARWQMKAKALERIVFRAVGAVGTPRARGRSTSGDMRRRLAARPGSRRSRDPRLGSEGTRRRAQGFGSGPDLRENAQECPN
jgi:hypothetical protein